LEFSGLHYCLFVKDQCFFVAVVLSGNSDILSRPLSFVNNFFKNFFVLKSFRFSRHLVSYHILSVSVNSFFKNFLNLIGSCFVVLALPQQRI